MKPHKNKEVLEFFERHPELNEPNYKQVRIYREKRQQNLKRQEISQLILKHLPVFPDEFAAYILSLYYEGYSIKELSLVLNKTKKQTSRYLFGLRSKVLHFARLGGKIELKGRKIHREVIMQHKGKIARILLVKNGSGNLVWVSEDGLVLPEDVQEFLG